MLEIKKEKKRLVNFRFQRASYLRQYRPLVFMVRLNVSLLSWGYERLSRASNVQNSYIATADLIWLKQNLSSGDSIQLLNGDTYP